MLHFRKAHQNLVLNLKNFRSLCHGNAGQGRRHVKQRAFIERRHELGPKPEEHRHGKDHHQDGGQDSGPLVFEHKFDDRMVNAHHRPADGMVLLVANLSHENRIRDACQPPGAKLEVLLTDDEQCNRRT